MQRSYMKQVSGLLTMAVIDYESVCWILAAVYSTSTAETTMLFASTPLHLAHSIRIPSVADSLYKQRYH